MALILARSPYFISIGTVDDAGVFTSLKTPPYNLLFRNETHLDISPFIRDYLIDNEVLVVRTTLSGTSGGNATADVTEEYTATDGYAYYEDGANKDFTDTLKDETAYYAGSNNVIYRNRKEPVKIPLLCADDDATQHAIYLTTARFYKDNTELSSISSTDFEVSYSDVEEFITSERIQYIEEDIVDSFEERVLSNEGAVYESNCGRLFHDAYEENTPNRVVITPVGDDSKAYELTIVPVQECNHTPHKLIFINRFGVEEELWFFKKSVDNITTSRESFRANTLPNYLSGDLSQHSYASYNLNGKKTMNMNTGFIPESFKQNIRQLMLSEKVWIYLDGNKLPITIKNSDMVLKKAVNEKLINYEIEIEFAYDIINNIG
jgi:hypothetical protein